MSLRSTFFALCALLFVVASHQFTLDGLEAQYVASVTSRADACKSVNGRLADITSSNIVTAKNNIVDNVWIRSWNGDTFGDSPLVFLKANGAITVAAPGSTYAALCIVGSTSTSTGSGSQNPTSTGTGVSQSCSSDTDCAASDYCGYIPFGGSECRPRAKLGEFCNVDPCLSNLICVTPKQYFAPKCVTPTNCASDAQCAADEQCLSFGSNVKSCVKAPKDSLKACTQSCDCPTGEYCRDLADAPKQCIRFRGEGETCTPFIGKCKRNFVCITEVSHSPPHCVASLSCDADTDCPAFHTCLAQGEIPNDKHCVLQSPLPTCSSNADCPYNTYCNSGQCRTFLGVSKMPVKCGGADGECGRGRTCEADSLGNKVCQTVYRCDVTSDCPSGRTCKTQQYFPTVRLCTLA